MARRNSATHAFVEELEELGVSLYWHAQNIETLLANGKRNSAAGVMFSASASVPAWLRLPGRGAILGGQKERLSGRPTSSG